MSDPLSVISGGLSIIRGLKGQKQAKKAADEQEEISRMNALAEESETQEQARRMTEAEEKTAAQRRAKAAASGVGKEGSMDIFMGAEEDEFKRELDWLLKSGKSRSDLISKSGKSAADQTRYAGDKALWGGIGSGVGQIGSAWDDGKFDWGF